MFLRLIIGFLVLGGAQGLSADEPVMTVPPTLECARILGRLPPRKGLFLFQAKLVQPLQDAFMNISGAALEIHSGRAETDSTTFELMGARATDFAFQYNTGVQEISPITYSPSMRLGASLNVAKEQIEIIEVLSAQIVFTIPIGKLIRPHRDFQRAPVGFHPRLSLSIDERYLLYVSGHHIQVFDLFEGRWAQGFQSAKGEIQGADFYNLKGSIAAVVGDKLLVLSAGEARWHNISTPKSSTRIRLATTMDRNAHHYLLMNTSDSNERRDSLVAYRLTRSGLISVGEVDWLNSGPIDWMKSVPLGGLFTYSSQTQILSYLPAQTIKK